MSRLGSTFKRYWNGEFPLAITIIGGWLGAYAIGRALSFVFNQIGSHDEGTAAWAYLDLVLLLAWFGANGVPVVFWVVGSWRSARSSESRGSMFWPGLVKAAIILLSAAFLAFAISAVGDSLAAARDDPEWENPQVEASPDGKVITAQGHITRKLAAELRRAVSEFPNAKTLSLESPGGRVNPAREIRDLVESRGMDTLVEEECYSACTIIFIGGRKRYISPEAKLAFHAPTFGTMPMASEAELQRREFQSRGVSSEFAVKAFPRTMTAPWFPTTEELVRAGVATAIRSNQGPEQ